jgi:NADH-quinone oxidoreductase subunit J
MSLLAQAAEGAAAGGSTAEVVLFWVFAVLALGAALAVVTMRNIVHGALMLVLNLLAVAGLYLSLESPFLSVIQILVYAGAIMVLFLFVIMLLGVSRDDLFLETRRRNQVMAIAGGALLAGAILFAFVGPYTGEASVCGGEVAAGADGERCVGLADAKADGDEAGVAFLGERMFTRYTLPFELSALLLTVATIGAVILARRRDLTPEDEEPAYVSPVPAGHAGDASEEAGVDVLGSHGEGSADEPRPAGGPGSTDGQGG